MARPTAIDADLDTQPIAAADLPHRTTSDADFAPAELDAADPPQRSTIDADLATESLDALPEPAAPEPTPAGTATEPLATTPAPSWIDSTPTTPLVVTGVTDDVYASTTTEELPAIFDGHADLVEYPPPRPAFRLRLSFLFALFAAAAMLMATVADVIDIRTTRPASGITTGVRTLEDLGGNLAMGGYVGVAAMLLGALLACFGVRWGAGMAGGAGLAVVGWAAMVVGLAELPISIAESITRTSSESFTLRVTRDLGFWLVIGVGVLGLLVFAACWRLAGRGGRPALNPIVAALTAVATVVLAVGPLVPVGDATFTDNFRSTDPARDLPTALFAGRLAQVALIALAGVVGMLLVRSFGLGLSFGGITVATWLWISSLLDLGSRPIGIAIENPGASSTEPHAVTTVGMVATLVLLIVAAVMASIRLRTPPARH